MDTMTDSTADSGAAILRCFNALRSAGSVPTFTAGTPAEAGAVQLYGVILCERGGMSVGQVRAAVFAYIENTEPSPGFPLAWPAPGALKAHRPLDPAAAIAEADLIRVFKRLQRIAHDCGTVTVTGKGGSTNHQDAPSYLRRYDVGLGRKLTWDEMFAERVRKQLGELSPAVASALEAVGGRVGLTEKTRTEFDRGHARNAFTEVVRTLEATGMIGVMKTLELPKREQRQLMDPDARIKVPDAIKARMGALLKRAPRRPRLLVAPVEEVGLDEAERVEMSEGELLERKKVLRGQVEELRARGLG